MNGISLAAGFIAMISVLCFNLTTLLHRPDITSGSLLLALVLVSCGLSVALGALVRALCLLALVYVRRGPAAVEWCSPADCTSFTHWVCCSWSFPGAGGRQEGLRVCGLGIALKGTHGQDARNS